MFSTPFHALCRWFSTRPYLLAVVLMLISTTGFSAMNVGVRMLSASMPAMQIIALRTTITILMLLPFALRHHAAVLRTTRLRSHFTRATTGAIGMISWTYSLALMPLTHATALSFTAPLLTSLFAVIFLKEKSSRARWIALFTGFLGTLVLLKPNPEHFDANALFVMVAATAWAATSLLIKSLTRTEPVLRIVFYMNFFMLIWTLPFALLHWQPPAAHAWFILVIIALCSILMHVTMAKAYSLADMVKLMPYDFSRLISTAIFAWIFFGETSTLTTWIGAAIIVASTLSAGRRDAKAAAIV